MQQITVLRLPRVKRPKVKRPRKPVMQQTFIFTDWVRVQIGTFMAWVGGSLYRLGVHPDAITVLGTGIVGLAAYFIAQGQFQLGGLILILGLPLDAVDGAVARAMGRKGKFGGILDSTLDRYADAMIFGGLSYYFAVQDRFDYMLLALAALTGGLLVSYVRARAGEAGLTVKVGLLDRLVRVIIILTVLMLPMLLELGLWVLAIGTNFTALQRMWYVYRHT
jgi:CDP-diacylglycerol---glycerol-3-phosphate 3-phosphatidyltransferase